jgi:phasin
MSSHDPFSAPVIPFQVPEQVRALAEKSVEQARENYARFKDVAEGSNNAIEASFTAFSRGMSEYSAKLVSFMQANTYAGFDFAQELSGVRSWTQAVDVWGSHTRRQFDTLASQFQELADLYRKIAAESFEPLNANVSKVFNPAA